MSTDNAPSARERTVNALSKALFESEQGTAHLLASMTCTELALTALDVLRALPVEQRMEAMGMTEMTWSEWPDDPPVTKWVEAR